MSSFNILVLPGDGIGPEVTGAAQQVLNAVAAKWGHTLTYATDLVGGSAIDAYGTPLRDETVAAACSADAVLFGAVGGPKWDNADVRPEAAILGLRKGMGVYANIRPVKAYPGLEGSSPLRPEVVAGTDLIIVRELTGGVYYGKPKRRWTTSRGRRGVDTMLYTEKEIVRILRVGFELARGRRKLLTAVDKANVLETGRLWREIAGEVAKDYPDVELEHILVDNAAMQIIRRPAHFDVIVAENTFGDILTDEASMLTGSLGMMPSASLGDLREDGTGLGMYEPTHSSAPDIAGQGIANPLGMFPSVAALLRHSCGLEQEAAAVEAAVAAAIADGLRTRDIAGPDGRTLNTREMADEVIARIRR